MPPGTLTLLLAPWISTKQPGDTYAPPKTVTPFSSGSLDQKGIETIFQRREWHCCCRLWLNQRPPGSRTDESLETKTKFPRTEGFASQWEGRCLRARITASLRFMQHLASADSAMVSKDSVKKQHLSALCTKDRFWGKVLCLRFKAMMMKK